MVANSLLVILDLGAVEILLPLVELLPLMPDNPQMLVLPKLIGLVHF